MRDKHAVLHTVQFEDIAQCLTEVQPFDLTETPIDVFICALGFEDRALAIATRLAQSDWYKTNPVGKAIICSYTTNTLENESKREALQSAISHFCPSVIQLPSDLPSDLAQGLRSELISAKKSNDGIRVMLDISAASGNLILSVMHVLAEISVHCPIALYIAYSEPAEYFPSEENYQEQGEALVLRACCKGDSNSPHEHGVSEVEINELYPGTSQENRPEYIIAIPSYRTERLAHCLQRLTDEPLSNPDQFIHWILGVPPSNERLWRLEWQQRVIRRLLSDLAGGNEESCGRALTSENHSCASTLDYRQITKILIERIDGNLGKNISLIHMGSKLQAIGASLALAARSEITVCYAKPARYNTNQYSGGIGPAWQILFSNFAEVVSSMRQIGTLRFIPRIQPEHTDLLGELDPQPIGS